VGMNQAAGTFLGIDGQEDCGVDFSSMVPFDSIAGDSVEDTLLLQEMATEATEFLSGNHWCESIERSYLAYGIGGVVAVFLFQITSTSPDIDKCFWVIVGDLPPAYLVMEDSPTAADAIEAYCIEMGDWVEAVEKGESVEDLIPVDAPATLEFSNQLKGRLEFLRTVIVPRSRKQS
jgi:hypothetical protein